MQKAWETALRAAFPHTVPIFAGFGFMGIAYGLLMNKSGFSFYWPMLMAMTIFSGSVEFVAVKLLLSPFNLVQSFVIALFICLSIERLHVRHKKNTPAKTWCMYAGTVAAALFLGYVTSLPACKFYYDSTATKKNTLTKVSQDIMSKLDGDLKITTYVNLLDRDAYAGLPRMRNEDRDRFERYLRFKPEIKMEYVYYWDQSTNP